MAKTPLARVLVASIPETAEVVQAILSTCPMEFVTSFADGQAALRNHAYSHVVIGHLFAESRMFEFAQRVRQIQPAARIVCVKGAGRPISAEQRAGLDAAVRALGCDGFVDLTAGEI